jgi:hypothetical protein
LINAVPVFAHVFHVHVQYGLQVGLVHTSVPLTDEMFAVFATVQEFAVIVTGRIISR